MPMIALTAFYCLDRLAREAGDQEIASKPAPAAAMPAESGAAGTELGVDAQPADSKDSETTSTERGDTVDSSAPPAGSTTPK